eukprot:3215219-Alexandrium_andersonii.AAC.1
MPGLDTSARPALGGHVEHDHTMTALGVPLRMLEHVPIARPDVHIPVWLGTALQHTTVADHRPGVLRR